MAETKDYGTILPGRGIDALVLGMTQREVQDLLGDPEEEFHDDFEDGTESLSYGYKSLGLTFDFGSEDDYVLDTVRIERDDIRLFGCALYGIPAEALITLLAEQSHQPDEEIFEFSDDDGNAVEVIDVEDLGLSFWCVNALVKSVQLSHLWTEDDRPIFPWLEEREGESA